MSTQMRFGCPSAPLTLKALLKRSREALWIGLGLAMAAHAALSQLQARTQQQRAAKPLTTHFVKRQPRLTKPLELKKRPRPKRRQIQRKMVAVKVRAQRRQMAQALQPLGVIQRFAKPSFTFAREAGLSSTGMEPDAVAQGISGLKETKEAVDLSLEMLDIEALDTGRYHAMVIQDPSDRRSLRGFFHMAPIYAAGVRGVLAGSGAWSGTGVSAPIALRNVVRAINQYTDLRADEIAAVPYNSPEIMKMPLLLIYLRPLKELDQSQAENLGRYLISGGFAYCEDDNLPNTMGAPHMRGVINKALQSQGLAAGRDWRFERLPDEHALYHCYFDFDGLPVGGEHQKSPYDPRMQPIPYMEGVELHGRLILVLSCKNYMAFWGYNGEVNKSWLDRTAHFRFAINLAVFALTQEGSITNQVMDSLR